jgi:hypothetical protein
MLRALTGAPWYVPNWVLRNDAQLPTVREELERITERYATRIRRHPNILAKRLNKRKNNRNKRL